MTTTGKQMLFEGFGKPMKIVEAPIPPLKDGEILVKNLFTTLCGSDIHTFNGKRIEPCPTILGHEIVGQILQIGPGHTGLDHLNKQLAPGDTVTWSIFSSDPQSYYAAHGIPQKGKDLFKYGHAIVDEQHAFHGGLSEYCILKKGTCVLKVPDSVPIPVAATVNCAIATVAGALRVAGEIGNKNVVIFGMGLLGQTCAAMCREAGASSVIAIDVDDRRLAEAASFGADEFLLFNITDQPTIDIIRKKFSRNGADIVFDMSGSPDAMEAGVDMLAIGGTAVWIGAVFRNRKIQVDAEKIIRQVITIKGLHNYNYEDFVTAMDFISAHWKKYGFDRVIQKEFSLEQATEAFEYAVQHKPLRVGIRIS